MVLGELDGDGLQYRAVNACIQFLPTLDGKQLITVEDLALGDGDLHPAQQALVDANGSQCGFCTPGMLMAAVDLVKRKGKKLDEETIRHELEGNICRCTGYHNIVKAIQAAAAELLAGPLAAE